MPGKSICFIFLTACLIILGYAVYRDTRYGKDFSGDLRNRVVAARLEKDGRLPYFYKWRKGDGTRYYDVQNFDSLVVSNMTATPFFHQLLYPLADLDEQDINGWWLFVEYGMFLLMTGMALSLAGTNVQRGAVLGISCLFLLTDAWKIHVFVGEYYLCFPFLAMVFYFFIRKRPTVFRALMAGTMAIVLVLIRPNVIFFFVPFLFLLRTYNRRYWLFFFVPILLLTAWTVLDTKERALWQDYRLAMGEHFKEHQGLHPAVQQNDPSPDYPLWEGVDVAALDRKEIDNPMNAHSENGNVFVISRDLLHWKMPPSLLLGLSGCFIFLLTGLFYFLRVRPGNYDPAAVAILGYCMYMVSDLFSPIYRHQYYTVQWIFPVLLAGAIYRPAVRWPFRLIVIGLLLNISKISFIKMQHTIGEYLIMVALILLVLSDKRMEPSAAVSGRIADKLVN